MPACSGSKAERSLLSAIMQRTIKPSACGVSACDFSDERHGRIFTAALELDRKAQDIDMLSLIDAVGMDELLIDIAQEEGFSASLAAKHAQIVHESAMRRAVSRAVSFSMFVIAHCLLHVGQQRFALLLVLGCADDRCEGHQGVEHQERVFTLVD